MNCCEFVEVLFLTVQLLYFWQWISVYNWPTVYMHVCCAALWFMCKFFQFDFFVSIYNCFIIIKLLHLLWTTAINNEICISSVCFELFIWEFITTMMGLCALWSVFECSKSRNNRAAPILKFSTTSGGSDWLKPKSYATSGWKTLVNQYLNMVSLHMGI